MFLALFAILLIVLSLMKRSLEGKGGGDLAIRLSAILPPGSWQLVSETLARPEVKSWYLALFGWIGMLLVGTQMMKLIIKGIELIYGESGGHSFLGRQLRALLLFSVSSVVWFGAVTLTLFGLPLRQWILHRLGESSLARGFWTIVLAILAMLLETLVLALIYRLAQPGAPSWRSILPGALAATALWLGLNLLFGIYVRKTQYGPVFGGLAAAIGLMLWMELSAMLVFLGAAWNAENAAKATLACMHHARFTQ
jgi:membrane protein